jgi:hypothetical protein
MNLFGYVKIGGDNLSFALPIFEGNGCYSIQDVKDRDEGTIVGFIKQENLTRDSEHLIPLPEDLRITRKIGEKGVFIFIDYNGKAIVNDRNAIDDCYLDVFYSLSDIMTFLEKENEWESIERLLFAKELSPQSIKQIIELIKNKSETSTFYDTLRDECKKGETGGEICRGKGFEIVNNELDDSSLRNDKNPTNIRLSLRRGFSNQKVKPAV